MLSESNYFLRLACFVVGITGLAGVYFGLKDGYQAGLREGEMIGYTKGWEQGFKDCQEMSKRKE